MRIIFSLLALNPGINWPYSRLWWLGWLLMAVAILYGLVRSWDKDLLKKRISVWAFLFGLLVAASISSLFIGVRLPAETILPIPGLPLESSVPVIMVLSAIPWVLAAGLIGPFAAVLVAIFAGLLRMFWETHSVFTPLEMAGLALLFSLWIRQRYRTPFYRFLRSPFGSALLLAIVYAPVYVFTAFFSSPGTLAVRIDFALTQTWIFMLARGAELLLAGLVAEGFYRFRVRGWGRAGILEPSPSERSLQTRFLYETAPMIIILTVTLVIGDWIVAGNAARRMIRDRLESTAQVATESLPYFLETGQNLIVTAAQSDLSTLSNSQIEANLADTLRSVPYFRLLYFFDENGNPVTGYPLQNFAEIRQTPEEKAAVTIALRGVPVQTYTIRPWPGENTAQVSFIAAVKDSNGRTVGVLLGRTDLNSNPFTQPALEAISAVQETGGEGLILDENGRILYHPVSSYVMQSYTGRIPETENFFSDTSYTGTRKLVYFSEVLGRPWSVLVSVPAEQAQQLSLDIAVPLLGILLLLSAATYLVIRWSLGHVASSLKVMASEATLIADGRLDHPMPVRGVDEVGQFAQAFEQMRISLQARLEELKQLLVVSQGVAANLDAHQSLEPVLKAALTPETVSVRAVLESETGLNSQHAPFLAFGQGPSTELYAYIDRQLFEIMRNQEILSIPNTSRVRRLDFPSAAPVPGALIAWSLRHENCYNGVFWIAYSQPHTFTDEEIRYLNTLAGQATLAAANARLYASAEIGRQRLAAVLDSTPEPVFVVDDQLNLYLLNPAAAEASGLMSSPASGKPIREVISHKELLEMILSKNDQGVISKEISLPNNRIYYASVSHVFAENRPVGKVCILRDITHYKQLDTLKSDFVSTVSHDLRSPLTLMRGYTTMLQMVGDLNDQQKVYISKILSGVENMNRLVNNLLDLGRIEAGIGLKIEKVSANQIIERVVTSVGPSAHQKNIQMSIDHGGETAQVELEADPALLEQAVLNLVENSVKYTPVGGQVQIRLLVRPTAVVFEVRDSGIGIAPLDLPHVFEKFYRSGRREAHQQRGSGLGLAIVKSIAERHHGRTWADSYLGKGSTFFIEIPFKQPVDKKVRT